MKVRLLTDRAGQGFYEPAGSVVDLDRREARAMIAAGSAEPIGRQGDGQDSDANSQGDS